VLKFPLYYINEKYLKNLENIINVLKLMCFLLLMNMSKLQLFLKCVINLTKCMEGWMICCHKNFKKETWKQTWQENKEENK
jgi:hypothetical protein